MILKISTSEEVADIEYVIIEVMYMQLVRECSQRSEDSLMLNLQP